MQVLIFGAGASRPAGYPLSCELISTIEEFVRAEPEVMLRLYWDRWNSWRHNADGIIRELLSSPDPEVVLSLPDLYETALQAANIQQLRNARNKWEAGELSEEDLRKYEEYWKSEAHKKLSAGRQALIGFLECLRRFFLSRHYRDAKNRTLRDYLRRHLTRLSEGDVVVTLNWDTTAERTLAEEGDWNPITGYGFYKELKTMPSAGPLPTGLRVESKVTVLKLHGSIGWHPSNSGGLYFDQPRFLSQFGFWSNGKPLDLVDPEATRDGPPEGSVLLYPSFLKQLRGSIMQQVWHAAAESLRKAKGVDVYGYSLPESDIAVRALLNALRFRSEADELRLRVHDPGTDAQDRWKTFLGDKAHHRRSARRRSST